MLNRLRPMALGHVPLGEIIAELVRDRARAHPHIAFTHDVETLDRSYDDTVDLTLYRCVQESLTNAIRHANAKSIEVRVAAAPSPLPKSGLPDFGTSKAIEIGNGRFRLGGEGAGRWLELTVRDNGFGIASGQVPGFGLRGMQERVQALGGEFAIEAGDGCGTCVRIVIPVPPRSGST
jgi:two-component system, NarL family, sensor histidine kinase UhpB